MVRRVIVCFALCVSFLFAVPRLVNYQGKLFEGGGPVSGTRAVGYRVYVDVDDDGWEATDDVGWEQAPADVSVSDGLFTDVLDFSTGYQGGYDFSSLFGGGHALYLRVYVGAAGETSFSGCTALDPPERLLSSPYALYSDVVSNVGDGTVANQTLRWDGSSWVASSARRRLPRLRHSSPKSSV